MSKLLIEVKEKAFELRKKGYSIKEIAKKLSIAQSTSSLWLRDIELDKKAQDRLQKRNLMSYYKTSMRHKEKRELERKKYNLKASVVIKKINKNNIHAKLYCALLFWCEGTKDVRGGIKFTNSDPTLIHVFLSFFRQAFDINEKKFKALLHLHNYHNEKKQKQYWSKITNIPIKQFNKTYLKPNGGKRIRKDYPGCIAIKYYDSKTAKELQAIYRVFSKEMGA